MQKKKINKIIYYSIILINQKNIRKKQTSSFQNIYYNTLAIKYNSLYEFKKKKNVEFVLILRNTK